jgi:hypothetical protein
MTLQERQIPRFGAQICGCRMVEVILDDIQQTWPEIYVL